MTHRCRDCNDKPVFSLRHGTILAESRIFYRKWTIAIYLHSTNLKGISPMKLHREVDISQKTAWYMLQRLRKATESNESMFSGSVEVDEIFVGRKRKNMSNSKRKELKDVGRGAVGKTVVIGAKDRKTNNIRAESVAGTDARTLQDFVVRHVNKDVAVYTDEARAYESLPCIHESVKHSVSECIQDQAHTNGMESFRALMKRGYIGVYHKILPKHLDRHVSEFEHRHNIRGPDTVDQMINVVQGMLGKRLTCKHLIADNELDSGAKPIA